MSLDDYFDYLEFLFGTCIYTLFFYINKIINVLLNKEWDIFSLHFFYLPIFIFPILHYLFPYEENITPAIPFCIFKIL